MSTVGSTNIGKRLSSMEVSPAFDGYSRVVILVTDELCYEAGETSGRTLELECPWGTQQMAEDILSKIRGYQYQPFTADGALIDPSAELGDGITANGVYSGLYKQELQFDALGASKIEAPQDEEIDHEYSFQEVADRTIMRQFASTKSQFAIQADEIAARVAREGGDIKSFGWTLTEDGFILSSGSKTVFKADETGIEVTGKITATSGFIGNSSQGFEITSNAIRNGVLSMSDKSHYGVYIGTDGIVLGKGAFKVDSAGNLTAQNGEFNGTVKAGNIVYGGDAGTIDGDALSRYTITGGYNGAMATGDYGISTLNTTEGINLSLGYADFANGVFNGWSTANYLSTTDGGLIVNGRQVRLATSTFKDGSGNTLNLYYLTWS